MLTKDLLRTRTVGNILKPLFVNPDDPELLELAKALLGIYENGVSRTRTFLEGLAESCVNAERDKKFADGLWKVIRDRAEFSPVSDADYPALREKIFLRFAELLRSGALPENPREVREKVLAEIAPGFRELYGDLPEKETLLSFRKTFPKEALERYNMALVQTLLLRTAKLDLEIPAESDPQKLRALCRALRFFRLLTKAELRDGTIYLSVDGPASIFENGTKYGLQTASFFPAVCRLDHWKARCDVRLTPRPKKLFLDESSHLVCHFQNLTAGRPEEILLFAKLFRERSEQWELDDAPGFRRDGPEKLFFPDFSFVEKNTGRKYDLELFHRWHASQLEERLSACEEGRFGTSLLLGVDRSLLKKDGILKARLEASPYFPAHGFFFRDFPGVDNVTDLLERRES